MKTLDFESAVNALKPYLVQYLEERGINTKKKFKCLFPDHEDSTPSANVVGTSTDSPRFFCHGCGRSGDIFDAVQLLEKKPKVGTEWVHDTLKFLAEKYGIQIATKDLTEEEIYKLDTYRAYRAAAELIQTATFDSEKHKYVVEHLEFRQWDRNKIAKLGIGTVNSFAHFFASLKAQGFPEDFLEKIDLARTDIFNENNLIFTWRDDKGRPVGFSGRNLLFEEQKKKAQTEGTKLEDSKYINTRFKKTDYLYGINDAIKACPPLYIFEGQADATTAKLNGLINCVAVAGNRLVTEHINLLKDLHITDIVLCFDGDAGGQDRMKELLMGRLAGTKDLRVRVKILPDGEDVDSFIRKYSIEEFYKLAHWSAFEWRLQQYPENEDVTSICQQMIPLIVNESSPVIREQQCKALYQRTGISLKAIQSELNMILDAKAFRRSKERQNILDRTIYELKTNPDDAELILQKTQTSLSEVVRKHDSDAFSSENFIRELEAQKMLEESDENMDMGFELGPDLKELREALRGPWSGDVFMPFGGKANHGKTALLTKIAYSIATYNDDVTVIYHSIDDTINQIIPRFVCIAEGSCRLTQNMVRQPHYWVRSVGLDFVDEKRQIGYQKVSELAKESRLVIKDITHGATLPFAENLILHYKEKFGDRRIVYILDNIHKLRDFEGKDERVRFKAISEACKAMAIRHHIAFLGTVEYTKLGSGTKPTNNNIAETVQVEYDANFIAHVYNEVGDVPDKFTVCHKDVDCFGASVILPRVELIIGKNKITEQKKSLFLDFWPGASDYKYVSQETVVKESKTMKKDKNILDDSDDIPGFESKQKWLAKN